MNKGFWLPKSAGYVADGDPVFNSCSRVEPKRSHQWFVDIADAEVLPSKKQAVELPIRDPVSSMSEASMPTWDNASNFHSVQNPFIDKLLGTSRTTSFAEKPVGTDSVDMRRNNINQMFGGDASIDLSIPHTMDDSEACLSYGGVRRVKINQVKDSDNTLLGQEGNSFDRANSFDIATVAYTRPGDVNYLTVGQAYSKDVENVPLLDHAYAREHDQIGSVSCNYEKGDDGVVSIADTFGNGDSNIISFGSTSDGHDMIAMAKTGSSFNPSYAQASVEIAETMGRKVLDASNTNITRVIKPRPESVPRNKVDCKTTKKEAPNSFPSNVKSLISTGMLDGVPVKYVALSREELRGVIKGSGYLCGCQSCNFSKVLNAYEFERHAGCKTKHPNNHIYFENGKTIYQIVQELRSTPTSKLFEVIQIAFGSPINQKAFRSWKESFQAATRELQRIYGKEELNL